MGYGSYSENSRNLRANTEGYRTKSVNEIFKQNVERKMHDSMNPSGVTFRECLDSEAHPNATPIQFYLDVTGSMGHIPHQMIKDGLPTLMGNLIQRGVADAALMFGTIGDHECDNCPLQVAQFESGDAELDMWLTRSYLEGGGGGNAGESYLLAWYFAGNHIKTDAFNKRKQKGFVFTIGDEPCLRSLPISALKDIMGKTAVGQATYSREELLAKAQEQNHVFHIHLAHGHRSDPDPSWKEMLGKNLIIIDDHTKVAEVIANTVLAHTEVKPTSQKVETPKQEATGDKKQDIIL